MFIAHHPYRDFLSHEMREDYFHTAFFINVEYEKRQGCIRALRYAQIAVYATDIEGKQGRALSLEENAELIKDDMDEQMACSPDSPLDSPVEMPSPVVFPTPCVPYWLAPHLTEVVTDCHTPPVDSYAL